jgi:hypothetical protein
MLGRISRNLSKLLLNAENLPGQQQLINFCQSQSFLNRVFMDFYGY